MIIGISGRIGSGKDTFAKFIQEADPAANWEIKKFAGKLKLVASLLTGVPVEKFEDQEFKKQAMPKEWNRLVAKPRIDLDQEQKEFTIAPMTYREFLQKLGTDAIRDGLHTNTLVNALFADYRPIGITNAWVDAGVVTHDIYPNWLITDVRFPNEANAIKEQRGIVVRLTRGNEASGDLHPSETALDDYDFDIVAHNKGSLEDLRRYTRLFMNIITYNYDR